MIKFCKYSFTVNNPDRPISAHDTQPVFPLRDGGRIDGYRFMQHYDELHRQHEELYNALNQVKSSIQNRAMRRQITSKLNIFAANIGVDSHAVRRAD